MYDVHCVVVTDMTFLKKDDIMALDGDFPEFKVQVQKLAAKRAQPQGFSGRVKTFWVALVTSTGCMDVLTGLAQRNPCVTVAAIP